MKIIDCIQGEPDWYLARLGKVTASKFADATAKGTRASMLGYMDKLIAERMRNSPYESYHNSAMDSGTDSEPLARKHYADINRVTVEEVGFIERDEWTGCSPDGLVGDDGMLEIKCPLPHTHVRYLREKRFPTAYKKQVMGQLWIAERQWCDFVSFDEYNIRKPYFCVRVYRDEKFIRNLHVEVVMFINEMKAAMAQIDDAPF
jgi:putative phage-type endonuclease